MKLMEVAFITIVLLTLSSFGRHGEYCPSDAYETEIIFRTVQRIHPDMPEFIFYRKIGEMLNYEGLYFHSGIERYVTITIKDENGCVLQEIETFVQGGHHPRDLPSHENTFGLQFADFNFDGYLDLWAFTAHNPGTAGGSWAKYWLWNPETSQFEENVQLRDIRSMAHLYINEYVQRVVVSHRLASWHRHTISYKYKNGKFIAVETTDYFWRSLFFAPDYLQVTRTNLLTCEIIIETDPPNIQSYEIMTTVQIHPSHPIRDVLLRKWKLPVDSPYRDGGYEFEIAIIIAEEFATIQIDRLKICDGENPLYFADINGDGYMDMLLLRPNGEHYLWLWNPETEHSWRAFERKIP